MRNPDLAAPVAVAAVCAVILTACGPTATPTPTPVRPASGAPASAAPSPATTTVAWPAPADPMGLTVLAGLKPQPKEFLAVHVHAHLDVFVNGARVTVPAGIGIQVNDPAVKTFTLPDGSASYGGIQLCNDPCISPLHTHDNSGILHTETADTNFNTLGEFFTEWGVPLDASCVSTFCAPATKIAIYVDGALATGDPRAIQLTNQREIAVVIGTPPPQIPATADFSNA